MLTIAHQCDTTQSAVLRLRSYQHEAIDAIDRAERRGIYRLLVALPTGPALDGQRRLMRYLQIPRSGDLTKGDAADLITIAKASHALRKGVAHG